MPGVMLCVPAQKEGKTKLCDACVFYFFPTGTKPNPRNNNITHVIHNTVNTEEKLRAEFNFPARRRAVWFNIAL